MLATRSGGWAMRSSFFLVARRYCESPFKCFSTAALFTSLLFTPGASAQTNSQDGEPIANESKLTETRPEDPKKLEKYDVNRIGRRGIGHGFNIYSIKREHELGQNLAASFEHFSRVVNDPLLNDYVNRIAQKIVRNSDAEVPFTVRLIDSSEIPRAYGLPGGFLFVDSALLFAAESEAELAGVMAHEIAHVAARHATRALTRKQIYSFGGSLSLLAGPIGIVLEDAGGVAGPLSVKKFARDSEYEADLLGIEYAYSAGYDPEALLSALEKLHAMEVERSAAFAKIPGYHLAMKMPFHNKIARGFSNYPLTEDRIRRLQGEIATFLPDRKEYIVDTNEFQDIKARLLSLRGPLQLRRHSEDGNPNAPVLRRPAPDDSDTATAAPGNLRSTLTTVR